MTRDEFRDRLDRAYGVISTGVLFYHLFETIFGPGYGESADSRDARSRTLSFYQGFFTPIEYALNDMMLLQFFKAFDRNPRTASLSNLIREARSDASLVPHSMTGDLDAFDHDMQQSSRLLATLKQARDQRIAHVDSVPLPLNVIIMPDLYQLVESTKSVFSRLSYAHHQTSVSWDMSIGETVRHTTQILDALAGSLPVVRSSRN